MDVKSSAYPAIELVPTGRWDAPLARPLISGWLGCIMNVWWAS